MPCLCCSNKNYADRSRPYNSLERPCLGHLHGNLDEPEEPAGHALTVTAHVLSIGSRPPEFRPSAQPVHGAICKNVPSATLERLLGLSSELASDHEVTPVQAWNYIRCRPQFGGIEVRSLGRLAESLRNSVKCRGYTSLPETFLALLSGVLIEKLILAKGLELWSNEPYFRTWSCNYCSMGKCSDSYPTYVSQGLSPIRHPRSV